MQRVVVVYNERSSKAGRVREEVIEPLRKRTGLLVGKYSIHKTNLEDNAERLAKILEDKDIVVAVGGDGTATIVLNGIMLSGKEVEMMALPYGNFNDTAKTLEGLEGKRWYPLEIKVNGEHFWYVGAYFSVGMFAKSTKIFDEKDERKKLQRKGGGLGYSIWRLAKWYFRRGRKERLPRIKVNGELLQKGMTDYLAVNSARVAGVMKAGEYGLDKWEFYRSTGRLGITLRLLWYMAQSMVWEMPGKRTVGETLEFLEPETVDMQIEGEYRKLEGVEKIEVKKADFGVIIAKKVW